MSKSGIAQYQKQLIDIGFERAALFEAIRGRYGGSEVLYPGSSVHITPSLFFPHVVYVDQSPSTTEFFADMDSIQTYVAKDKHYKRSAYIRFIAQDFTAPLPVPKESFDLLISLYAGGVSQACKAYLKVGGILLTNNHQNDIAGIINDAGFRLRSVMRYRSGKFQFIDENLDALIEAAGEKTKAKSYLKSTSRGMAYREDIDTYFIFERCGMGNGL